jgi:hypothetical protein
MPAIAQGIGSAPGPSGGRALAFTRLSSFRIPNPASRCVQQPARFDSPEVADYDSRFTASCVLDGKGTRHVPRQHGR